VLVGVWLPGLLLALLLLWLARTRTRAALLPVLCWAVPIAFGLLYAFEGPLGHLFGLVLFVPFLLLPVAGIALAITGVVLVLRDRERPRFAVLLGAAAALTPAVALLVL